jgi:16S rRNA (adenine1518-N6/adenine1519-N6)-dimethyltransferase
MSPALPPLREVIARHGLNARKSLGQHFLLDLNLTARIARAAGDLRDATVLEVGPGPGGLTRALLEAGPREVIAVEKDRRAVAALAELAEAYPGRLRIVEADALEFDEPAGSVIVANLPYNVSTALLIRWLGRIARFRGLTLMFQKEVADRLVAGPGGKDYGRLSVMAQWLCEVRAAFEIPPRAFTPPPRVTSTVVNFTPRAAPEPADFAAMERVVAAAFGQRRKMLRQSLKALGGEALLGRAGVAPTARAEELSVARFAALARNLSFS